MWHTPVTNVMFVSWAIHAFTGFLAKRNIIAPQTVNFSDVHFITVFSVNLPVTCR
jgi:hypothetical protein